MFAKNVLNNKVQLETKYGHSAHRFQPVDYLKNQVSTNILAIQSHYFKDANLQLFPSSPNIWVFPAICRYATSLPSFEAAGRNKTSGQTKHGWNIHQMGLSMMFDCRRVYQAGIHMDDIDWNSIYYYCSQPEREGFWSGPLKYTALWHGGDVIRNDWGLSNYSYKGKTRSLDLIDIMSIYLSICLSVCLSIHLSIYLL